jgi:hypothetical protein
MLDAPDYVTDAKKPDNWTESVGVADAASMELVNVKKN